MRWRKTPDPDVIESPPFYIRRCEGPRYLLGRGMDCLGGFDTADEAKQRAEESSEDRKQS